MHPRPAVAVVLAAMTLFAAPAFAQDAGEARDKTYWERAKSVFEPLDRARVMEEIQRLYQQAKAAGEKVPADLLEWARQDLAQAGRWEYRVATMDGAAAEVEASLNELGRDRWECLSLSKEKGRWTAVMKRPGLSRIQRYFGSLTASDLMRLLGAGK